MRQLFLLQMYGDHRDLPLLTHSFPTRRSSDLIAFCLSWTSCDHTGPVHEGDTLRSTITVESVRPGPAGTRILDLRSVVEADAPTDGKTSSDPRPVLDWHFTVLAGPASQGAQR